MSIAKRSRLPKNITEKDRAKKFRAIAISTIRVVFGNKTMKKHKKNVVNSEKYATAKSSISVQSDLQFYKCKLQQVAAFQYKIHLPTLEGGA